MYPVQAAATSASAGQKTRTALARDPIRRIMWAPFSAKVGPPWTRPRRYLQYPTASELIPAGQPRRRLRPCRFHNAQMRACPQTAQYTRNYCVHGVFSPIKKYPRIPRNSDLDNPLNPRRTAFSRV
jgi:hypothetical protein